MLELNLIRYKYKILISMIIGAVIAYSISLFIPSEWKASTSILIGKNYMDKNNLSLEQINIVIQRLRQKTIHDNILIKTGINPNIDSRQAKLFYNSLTISQIKDSEAIEVSIKANSKLLAKQHLEMLINTIFNEHNRINNAILSILQDKENIIKHELESLEANYKSQVNSNYGSDILHLNLNQLYLNNKFNYYKDLAQIHEVKQNINNYPTKLITSIYVEDRKSFPNPIIFILIGAILGFICSYLILYFLEFNKKIKNPRVYS